ncbi:MAG: hypothetical protein A2297_04030 [Elusimicrobia bacterium RIFOXYB2_FULL_48_7]|nr:MAG: hypothetical protein A2297_04030 [Elusimicrobia bacterium RIFOXYB2_FULL_48_7]
MVSSTSGKNTTRAVRSTVQNELPKNYGDTKIVLMPRDPFWSYAYWEINRETRDKLKKEHGNKGKLTLRVYDVTDIDFNGSNAHKHFDIYVSEEAENWYINVPEVNRAWCVDLGLLLPDGRFILIARSNFLSLPRHGVSSVTDEHWAILQKEFEKMVKLSGIDKIGQSSFDVSRLMKERWEQLMSMPSSHVSSFNRPVEAHVVKEGKNFWLRADTELIVYGTTESDAKLTIGDKEVKLNPDGSFSLRMHLHDGEIPLPIKATSKDGSMSKKITFKVTRTTK